MVDNAKSARHFSEYVWVNNMYDDWGSDIDSHRACAIITTFKPWYYLPDPRVKEWLEQNWLKWEEDPPVWFNREFKDNLHPSLRANFTASIDTISVQRRRPSLSKVDLFYAYIETRDLENAFATRLKSTEAENQHLRRL